MNMITDFPRDLTPDQRVNAALASQRIAREISSQVLADRLLAGWQAAEAGAPFDAAETRAWQEGWELRKGRKPSPRMWGRA